MNPPSASYRVCKCGADCNLLESESEGGPCWGQVNFVDEMGDGSLIHACQGHLEHFDWCCNSQTARQYIPEPAAAPELKDLLLPYQKAWIENPPVQLAGSERVRADRPAQPDE